MSLAPLAPTVERAVGDSLNINRAAAAKRENTTETSMNGNEYEPAVKKMIWRRGRKGSVLSHFRC